MSEVWNVGGGVSADPVVSAVLGAIGKEYVVEEYISEDGNTRAYRYSNGKIETFFDNVPVNGDYRVSVVFPFEYTEPPAASGVFVSTNTDYYLALNTKDASTTQCLFLFQVESTRLTKGTCWMHFIGH